MTWCSSCFVRCCWHYLLYHELRHHSYYVFYNPRQWNHVTHLIQIILPIKVNHCAFQPPEITSLKDIWHLYASSVMIFQSGIMMHVFRNSIGTAARNLAPYPSLNIQFLFHLVLLLNLRMVKHVYLLWEINFSFSFKIYWY